MISPNGTTNIVWSDHTQLRQRIAELEAENMQLRQQHLRDQTFFERGPLVFFKWVCAAGWPVEYASPNVFELLGYQAEALTSGRVPYTSVVHPDDIERVAAEVHAYSSAHAETFEQEYRLIDAAGETRWIYDFTTVLRDDHGTITHYYGYILDISAHKRSEEQLHQNQQLLQTLFAHLPVAVFGKEAQTGRFTFWNHASEVLFGLKMDEIIGKTDYDLFPQEQADFFRQKDQEVFAQGQTLVIEEEPVDSHALGRRLLRTIKSPVYDEQGKPLFLLGITMDITEQKQAEERLFSQVQLFDTLINTLPFPVFFKDADEVYRGCNHAFATDFCGTSVDAVVGKTVYDLLPADLAAFYHRADVELLARGGTQIYERDLLFADGTPHTVIFNKAVFLQPDGTPGGIVGALIDITERKQAEEERDQLFRLSPDMLCIAGFDGYFKRLNPAWQRVLGFTDAELFAEPFLAFVHPDDRQSTIDAAQNLAEGQTVISFTNRYRCKDGSYRWIEWVSSPVLEQQAIYAVARDVTERKRAEDELRTFKMLVDTVPDGVGIAGFDGLVVYANPAFQEMTGYGAALVGTHLSLLQASAEHARIPAIMQELLTQGSWQGVLNHQRKDGTVFPVYLSSTALFDSEGNPWGHAAIMRDMTEQQRQEAERTALQQQIIEAQQIAIRELSTPLLPLDEHVLALPLVGTIDSTRAQQVMETLLEGIARHKATIAIVDITGVQVVDTQVANALIRAAQAAKLLGAQVVLTGIRPEVAQTLVQLGTDLRGIVTRGTLQSGITYALGQTHRGAKPGKR